ncbi:MAG: hypothetical protein QME96_06080 [Myxococcota bacterium]|nr:hypothetical protein [Myxococcota bacterium]
MRADAGLAVQGCALVVMLGCGMSPGGAADADAGSDLPDFFPDLGEIPDGHVLFVFGYRQGEHGPRTIYVEENRTIWRHRDGSSIENVDPAWVRPVGWPRVPKLTSPVPATCRPCELCEEVCSVESGENKLYRMANGSVVTFLWNGNLIENRRCGNEVDCSESYPAPPGRYSVNFSFGPGYGHTRDYPTRYWVDYAGWSPGGPVEFEYPRDQIVWYVFDCSEIGPDAPPALACL